jgi:hypothetical protein
MMTVDAEREGKEGGRRIHLECIYLESILYLSRKHTVFI